MFYLVNLTSVFFCTGCDTIDISGTKYNSQRHGMYVYQPDQTNCGDRPVYLTSSGSRDYFLYYFTNRSVWVVRTVVCGSSGFLAGYDSSYTPDIVTTVWRETWSGSGWYSNSDIEVKCRGKEVICCCTLF